MARNLLTVSLASVFVILPTNLLAQDFAVTVFDGVDGTGHSVSWTLTDSQWFRYEADVSNLAEVRSIVVGDSVAVFAFDQPDYQSALQPTLFLRSEGDLRDQASIVSSLIITRRVRLHGMVIHKSAGGSLYRFIPLENDSLLVNRERLGSFNDRIDEIRLVGKVGAILYEHPNMHGRDLPLTREFRCEFGLEELDDQWPWESNVSSIVLFYDERESPPCM